MSSSVSEVTQQLLALYSVLTIPLLILLLLPFGKKVELDWAQSSEGPASSFFLPLASALLLFRLLRWHVKDCSLRQEVCKVCPQMLPYPSTLSVHEQPEGQYFSSVFQAPCRVNGASVPVELPSWGAVNSDR